MAKQTISKLLMIYEIKTYYNVYFSCALVNVLYKQNILVKIISVLDIQRLQ